VAQVASEPAITAGAPEGGEPTQAVVGRSLGELFWRRFRRDKFAIAGIVFLVILAALALFAGVIADHIAHRGPNDVNPQELLDDFGLPVGPNGDLWFGADNAGRDLFVRILYGARTSLIVAFFATGISVIIGVLAGLVAGFYRGKVDTFVSRIIDIVMSLPVLLLAVGLVAACGLQPQGCLFGLIRPGILLVSYVIGLFNWPYIARIVRGQVLSLREKEFIEAARAQGAGNLRIIGREVLPNVAAPIIVYTTLIIPNNILFEAALSFLGIGVPALTPSWGKMLAEGSSSFIYAPWMMWFPGLFLFLTVLAFNLVGDGLRDALDPRTAR
jgi:ABC-type dipeptide/oligopeptide/nickel transport system permease subunit